jgi:hypothetical protein
MNGPKPPKPTQKAVEDEEMPNLEDDPGPQSITKLQAPDPKVLESMKPPIPREE